MCSSACGPCGPEFIERESCYYPGCKLINCNDAVFSELTAVDDTDHSSSSNSFSDPSFEANNWAYHLLNVAPVWRQGITGKGIRIRINDPDGVDADHPEFDGKFDYDASCESYQSFFVSYSHGTSCASIAAARGDNGECSVGIAPGANISACLLGYLTETPNAWIHALDAQDISSNSYGISDDGCDRSRRLGVRKMQTNCPFQSEPKDSPCADCDFSSEPLDYSCMYAISSYCSNRTNYLNDDACLQYLELFATCEFGSLSPEAQAALTKGVKEGRDGKGLVFVFSAGNDFDTGSDTNFQAYTSSRLVITVASVAQNGTHASYSNTGAGVFVSAPGGESDPEANWVVATPQDQCEGGFAGTSAAAPAVAGVIALILEANPNLSWRDVQGILASTSQVMDSADDSWTTNDAGFNHSYKYGFGVVDAAAAVEAAGGWVNFGAEAVISASSGLLNVTIEDNGTEVLSSVTVNGIMTVESAVVYLDLDSLSRGHLKIVLTSPGGTESMLTPGMRPENGQLLDQARWKLMTVRSWGESSAGEWTLSVSDTKPGDVEPCVDLPLEPDDDVYNDDNSLSEGCAFVYYWSDECSYADYMKACCACGGGLNASSTQDKLVSWILVIYGRDKSGNLEPTLSPGPTFSTETLPITEFPTESAFGFPTSPPWDYGASPTIAPTLSPLAPSAAPTALRCPEEGEALDDCLRQNQVDGFCLSCIVGYWPEEVTSCSDVDDETCLGLDQCSCDPCGGYIVQFVNCLLLDDCVPLQCPLGTPTVAPAQDSTPTPIPQQPSIQPPCDSEEEALDDCLFRRTTAVQLNDCMTCMGAYVGQVFPATGAGSSRSQLLRTNASCEQLHVVLCPAATTDCPACDPCRGEYASLLECQVDVATTGCELSCSGVLPGRSGAPAVARRTGGSFWSGLLSSPSTMAATVLLAGILQ